MFRVHEPDNPGAAHAMKVEKKIETRRHSKLKMEVAHSLECMRVTETCVDSDPEAGVPAAQCGPLPLHPDRGPRQEGALLLPRDEDGRQVALRPQGHPARKGIRCCCETTLNVSCSDLLDGHRAGSGDSVSRGVRRPPRAQFHPSRPEVAAVFTSFSYTRVVQTGQLRGGAGQHAARRVHPRLRHRTEGGQRGPDAEDAAPGGRLQGTLLLTAAHNHCLFRGRCASRRCRATGTWR